jgi:uncharacterized protein DUF3667
MSELPVPVVSPPELPRPETLVCANCHAALNGEYCAACGQRHEPHIHTVAHFAGEAFESISHADSRLWRTLWYLFARPGFLTREFFAGRRVAYLPPFRLYLVISVLFFLVVGLPDSAVIVLDDEPGAGAATQAPQGAPPAGAWRPKGLAKQNAVTEFCKEFERPDPTANENYARLHESCAKIAEDGGAELGRTVVRNIPKAMFVFLPLLAAFMMLLYWRPKRYYVEHLLFLIHNHAFVFMSLAVVALLKRIPVVGSHLGLLEFAMWLYMAWYLFRAMRNVYQQRRGITVAKYFTIGFAYVFSAILVLFLTTLYSAMIAGTGA